MVSAAGADMEAAAAVSSTFSISLMSPWTSGAHVPQHAQAIVAPHLVTSMFIRQRSLPGLSVSDSWSTRSKHVV